jgi:F420-dependent methylenetetrahydromethanopterin dehydrogenase
MKTAISIPDPLFHAAERAAKRQKVSRSRFYAKAVAAYLKSQREREITGALDAVYASQPSEIDPFVAAAAYHVFSSAKRKTQRAKEVKEALDAIYATEDSSLDPEIARMQSMSIGREEW